ncbi:MAG: hypothetical protein RJB66_499 [Pseudomonadota bacterium]
MKKHLMMGAIISLLLAAACSKSSNSGSDGGSGTTHSLKVRMVSSGVGSDSLFRMNTVDANGFLNSSIGSGPADEVTFKVTSMVLGSSTDHSVNVPIFSDSSGKALTVRDSSVDMSNFFTKLECIDTNGNPITVPEGQTCQCGVKADGTLVQKVSMTLPDGTTGLGCPELAAGETAPLGVMSVNQTGTFDKLTVTYKNLGQMKGCVSGKYKANTGDTSGAAATNCTRSGKGLDANLPTTTSDFGSVAPENMNVYLGKSGSTGGETFQKEYMIAGGITVGGDSTPSITLLIDTGRLLRFYNANTNFSTPGPSYSSLASKAFFFTTVFEESTYIFVGTPGSVLGYRWATSAANWSQGSAPGDRLCASSCSIIAGWMTLILDPSGNPILASLMPDDDNSFTVIKGANYSTTTPGALDSTAITRNSSSNWDIRYNLGTQLTGTIFGFDPTGSMSSTQNKTFTTTSAAAGTGNSWGEVTFTRQL